MPAAWWAHTASAFNPPRQQTPSPLVPPMALACQWLTSPCRVHVASIALVSRLLPRVSCAGSEAGTHLLRIAMTYLLSPIFHSRGAASQAQGCVWRHGDMAIVLFYTLAENRYNMIDIH